MAIPGYVCRAGVTDAQKYLDVFGSNLVFGKNFLVSNRTLEVELGDRKNFFLFNTVFGSNLVILKLPRVQSHARGRTWCWENFGF